MSARTHYDVLGVAPDASTDEIRRAYASAARAAHPDRRPPAEADAAAVQMAAVNEAWRTLRDPARRADYDVAVGLAAHPDSPAAHAAATTSAGARPRVARPPRTDAPPPMVAPTGRGCGSGAWLAAGLLTALLLVGALVAFVATVPRSEPATPAPPASDPYAVGTCVLVAPSASGPVAVQTTCSGPVSGRIEATVAYPAPCPPGSTAVPLVAERTTLCLVAP